MDSRNTIFFGYSHKNNDDWSNHILLAGDIFFPHVGKFVGFALERLMGELFGLIPIISVVFI